VFNLEKESSTIEQLEKVRDDGIDKKYIDHKELALINERIT